MVKYRIFYIILFLLLCIGYTFLPGYFFWVALVTLLILPLISLALTLLAIRKLTVQLDCTPKSSQKGLSSAFHISLIGKSHLPIAKIRVSLRTENRLSNETISEIFCFSAPNARTFSFIRECTPLTCGTIFCHIDQITLIDFLGLFSFNKPMKLSACIETFPSFFPLDLEFPSVKTEGNSLPFIPQKIPTGDSIQIRPFQDGDSLRSIHWKLSAKQEALIVRENFASQNGILSIYLDFSGNIQELDCLLEALGMLGATLSAQQIPFRFLWYSNTDHRLVSTQILTIEDLRTSLQQLLSHTPSVTPTLSYLSEVATPIVIALTCNPNFLSAINFSSGKLLVLTTQTENAIPQENFIIYRGLTPMHLQNQLKEALSALQDEIK